jgi:hypothetical protein
MKWLFPIISRNAEENVYNGVIYLTLTSKPCAFNSRPFLPYFPA